MKLFLILCFVAVACAAPQYQNAEIVHYDNDNTGTGDYKYSVEQSDGINQEAVGEFKGDQAYQVKGFYSWPAPDGYKYVVNYVADEGGYRSTIEKVAIA